MSVRQSLLAILDQGPCYGYQLRAEFDRRTASRWPLNVGQIYNTLDRLERDGLVEKAETDAQGHVYWRITPAGSDDVRAWLSHPVLRSESVRDELVLKLAVAATLPGVDVGEIVRAQREASRARRDALAAQYAPLAESSEPDAVLAELAPSAALFAADGEVRWLDHVAARLAGLAPGAAALALSDQMPVRGRPRALRPDTAARGSAVREPGVSAVRAATR